MNEHLRADEYQQDANARLQIAELVGNGCEQKEHGTQAEDGEDVGKEHDVGSSETEKTAGILSKANIKSLNSMTKTVTKSGVRSHLPLRRRVLDDAALAESVATAVWRMKNLSPSNFGCIRPVFVRKRTSGCFSTLISSFLLRLTYIFTPLYIRSAPKSNNTQSKRL